MKKIFKKLKKWFDQGKITKFLAEVILVLVVILFCLEYENLNLYKNYIKYKIDYFVKSVTGYDFDNIDVDTLVNNLHNNSDIEKYDSESLCDKNLFEDIFTVDLSNEDLYRLNYVTENLNILLFENSIEYYSPEHVYGYVYALEGEDNNIYLLNDSEQVIDVALAHEFIHTLQANSDYKYIIEACAEIISEEYYSSKATAYFEARQNMYALMEIIGPSSIWTLNFSGDDYLLKDELRKYLTDEETKEFLSYLKKSPAFEENISEYDSKIHDYINILYERKNGTSIENDFVINKIYNSSSMMHFNAYNKYFNYEAIVDDNNKMYSRFEDTIDINDTEKIEELNITPKLHTYFVCSVEELDELDFKPVLVSKDEFNKTDYADYSAIYYKDYVPVNISYVIFDDMLCMNNEELTVVMSLEEAIDTNQVVLANKVTVTTDISLSQALEYDYQSFNSNYNGQILYNYYYVELTSLNDNVGSVYFYRSIDNDGNIKYKINYSIIEKMSSIYEKFPEQFDSEAKTLIKK